MKKITIKAFLQSLLFLTGLIFIFSCEEIIVSPKKDGLNATISIKGNRLDVCRGDTIISPAPFARFACVHKTGNGLDTLFQGVLDAMGEWDSVYNIELLGIPNVRVDGMLDLRTATDSVFYICCDTLFVLNFVYNCDEVDVVDLDCGSLNNTVDLNLTNRFGGKIMLGTSVNDISGNILQLAPQEEIIVNVSQLLNLTGDFTATLSSVPDALGNVQLGPVSGVLEIIFSVRTDVPGTYKQTFELPTSCANQPVTGNVVINLTAEVTDNDCSCPFAAGSDAVLSFYPFSESIPLGTSSAEYSREIINASDLGLSEGCYLAIDSISRFNSTVAVTSSGNQLQQHEWIITGSTTPLELRNGVTSFSPSVVFTPYEVGESADTFNIYVSVYNAIGDRKDVCSFLICYHGDCCGPNSCPIITKLNDLPASLIDGSTGSVIGNVPFGEKLDMGSGNRIQQTMNGQMGTLCTSFFGDNQLITYAVSLPVSDTIIPCSPVTVLVEKSIDGAFDDTGYFTLINSYSSLDEGGITSFSVQFNTPDVQTYITSGHSSVYKAKLMVRAIDSSGELCAQQIDLEANVSSKNYKISKSTNMKAFSQISDKESNRAYAVYRIDEYNSSYKYYGQQDKLDPDRGTVNIFTSPQTPNTNHSFFFEVDQPENLTLRQRPKLYLVNTELNKYSSISAQPIARYTNNSEFNNDLDELMEEVFKGSFQSRGAAPITSFTFNTSATEIMWTPSVNAVQLSGAGNGLEINMGEVYVVWNPTGNHEVFTSNGVSYNNYCDVAFLYIEEVSDGDNSAHNIGNVTFYVVYPLTTIIQ